VWIVKDEIQKEVGDNPCIVEQHWINNANADG